MLHGARRAYRAGCRCVQCRAANAAYVAARRASPVGLVDATPARIYLRQLAALGVGLDHAAQASGVSLTILKRVRSGRQARIRPATVAAILAVRPTLARGAVVAGTKTWRYVDSLEREGYTRREIAFDLGARSQQLQLHRRVRVSTALRVAALYARIAA